MSTSRQDPTQVSVQLNVQVPWWFRERLHAIAIKRKVPVAQLIRETLMQEFPDDPAATRQATRDAGATK